MTRPSRKRKNESFRRANAQEKEYLQSQLHLERFLKRYVRWWTRRVERLGHSDFILVAERNDYCLSVHGYPRITGSLGKIQLLPGWEFHGLVKKGQAYNEAGDAYPATGWLFVHNEAAQAVA